MAQALRGPQDGAVGMVAATGREDASQVVRAVQRPHWRLSAAQVAELVAAYEGGATTTELGKRFGVDRSSVNRHLSRAGVEMRPVKQVSQEQRAQAAKLYGDGLTVDEVATRLRLSYSATYRALQKEGVRMRPAAPRRRFTS